MFWWWKLLSLLLAVNVWGLPKRADPLNPRDLLKIPNNPWQKADTPSIPEVLSLREPRAQACEASTDEFCPAEADLSDLRDTQATQAEEARFSGYSSMRSPIQAF